MVRIISYTLMSLVAFAIFVGGGYVVWNRGAIVHGRHAPYAHLYPMGITSVAPDAWTAGYLAAEPNEKVIWVRELLSDAVASAPTTLKKVEVLVGYLLAEVPPYMGVSDPVASHLTGLQTLDALLHGRASVQGDNLTRAYVASANALGIPTRIVAVGSSEEVASHPAHLFAESYVCEHDTWAFVDLTARKAYVAEGNGRPLNTVEISERLQRGEEAQLVVALYQGGEVVLNPYGPHCNTEKERLSGSCVLCYPRAGHLYGSSAKKLAYDVCFPKQTFCLR